MIDGSICGLFSFGGIVYALYVNVSSKIYAIACASKKGPLNGVKFWCQFLLGIVSIVMVLGSFFGANLAQCMAI